MGAGETDFTVINRTDDFFRIRAEEAERIIATVGRALNTVSLNFGVINFVGVAAFSNRRFVQIDIAADSGNCATAFSVVKVNRVRQFALTYTIACIPE